MFPVARPLLLVLAYASLGLGAGGAGIVTTPPKVDSRPDRAVPPPVIPGPTRPGLPMLGAPGGTLSPLEEENGYLKLGFDRLASYRFRVPEFDPAANPGVTPPTGEEQIPESLKSLSGKKVRLTGFMLPLKMEGSLVTEFLLLSDPMMCCYGIVPDMNQWVIVKMKKGVRPLQDVPLAFFGTLKVGAMFEQGYMTGIYLLDGERMGELQG
jgi:hypothetical protein